MVQRGGVPALQLRCRSSYALASCVNKTRLEDSRRPTISPPTTYSKTKCQLEVGEHRPGTNCGMSAAPAGSLCTCEASSARSYSQCDGAAVVARRRSDG